MSTPVTGIRARNRAAIHAAIIEVGRRHLALHGAAGLSVRAIARELGMASSAIYRYVATRDELLTLLIVTAYDEVADRVDAALAVAGPTRRQRFYALGRAMREWAREHPHDWALLYGSPVPAYQAPGEVTNEAGTRIPRRMIELLGGVTRLPASRDSDALRRGWPALEPMYDDDPGLRALETQAAATGGSSKPVLQRGLAVWFSLLGALNAEIFEYLGDQSIADPEAHFDAMLALAADLALED